MIRVGDVVRLRAGGDPMVVVAVYHSCDGTSSDGDGLACAWWEDGKMQRAVVSESSVVLVPELSLLRRHPVAPEQEHQPIGRKRGVHWDGTPMQPT